MGEQRVICNHATMVLNKQYAVTQSDTFSEKVSGIYIIQDMSTNRSYVGATQNMNARWSNHRTSLINYPAFSEIQYDFKKNPQNFVFVLIERCTIDQLQTREAFWVNEYQALDPERGYNIRELFYPKKFTRIRVPAV